MTITTVKFVFKKYIEYKLVFGLSRHNLTFAGVSVGKVRGEFQ